MLPQYQRLMDDNGSTTSSTTINKSLIRLSFGKFAFTIVALPFFGFIFCVIWSILFFFDRSTQTHCHVPNYLPSISAAIGNYQPQRFIWQLAIILQVLPRLMVSTQYMKYYNVIIRKNRRLYAYTACIFNIVENLALVGLSLWTSSDNYEIHKTCFIIFIVTSEFYMLVSYLVNKYARKLNTTQSSSIIDKKSLKYKRNLFYINFLCFILAGYFFTRHNSLCEPGVYTIFAFLEYIVVLTNMGYHMTAYWDFNDNYVIFDLFNGFYISSNYSYI